jgi:hypothetical protein
MTNKLVKMRPSHKAYRSMLREAADAIYRAADMHARLARHHYNRRNVAVASEMASYATGIRKVGDMLVSMADGEEFALVYITGHQTNFPKEDDASETENDSDHI